MNLVKRTIFTRRSRIGRREDIAFILYIMPWIIGFSLFTIVPMCASLYYSFHTLSIMDLVDEGYKYVGLANYKAIFKDTMFMSSIGNTFFYAFAKTFLILFVGLILALFINTAFKGNKIVRVLIYLPAIIPGVASIIVWSQLFSKDFSLLNYFLSFFGIPAINWTSTSAAMPSVILMGVWGGAGPQMLIILAALQSVPQEIIEASKIDGAGPLKRFFNITLPCIAPTLFFLSLTGIIGGLQAYAEMQLLFGQGTDQTMTMAWNVVLHAMSLDGVKTMGYACAQAWFLFVIILCFTIVYFIASKKLMPSDGKKK